MKLLAISVLITFLNMCETPTQHTIRDSVKQYPLPTDLDVLEVEGQRMHFKPELVGKLRIIACGAHFPTNSQGYENLQTVIDFFNATPYIKIKFNPEISLTSGHIHENDLYGCGDNLNPIFNDHDIYVCFVDSVFERGGCTALHGEPRATASVAKYVANQKLWNCCTNEEGVPFDKAILRIKSTNFAPYVNNSSSSRHAPSTGILAHEFAHMFYMGHYGKNGPLEKRPIEYQQFEGLCNGVGNFDIDAPIPSSSFQHRGDFRSPRMTAYSRAIFDAIYPITGQQTDDKYEWTIHQVLTFKDSNGRVNSTIPKTIRFFNRVNPKRLLWNGNKLVDRDSGEDPVFYIQFSNPSNKPVSGRNKVVQINVELIDNLENRIRLKKMSVFPALNGEYVQYHAKMIGSTVTQEDINQLRGNQFQLMFSVDSNDQFEEFDETNNEIQYTVDFSKWDVIRN